MYFLVSRFVLKMIPKNDKYKVWSGVNQMIGRGGSLIMSWINCDGWVRCTNSFSIFISQSCINKVKTKYMSLATTWMFLCLCHHHHDNHKHNHNYNHNHIHNHNHNHDYHNHHNDHNLNIDMYLVYIQVKNVSLNALCELYNAPVNPMKEQVSSAS